MKTRIVYESMWGNTERVARAVARGLGGAPVTEVADTLPSELEDLDLLVVGGPTHAFSMSREATRQDAHRHGAARGSDGGGIRELLAELPGDFRVPVATFDTRVARVRHLPGSAAKAAEKDLRHAHHAHVVARESFYVKDTPGPLLGGELDRAEAWGAELERTTTP
jgi:Flavodoxin